MNTSRRRFLCLGTAAAVAGLVTPLHLSEAAPGLVQDASLPLSADEDALLQFAAAYGRTVRLVGVGVLEKLRFGRSKHVHVLVEVDALTEFTAHLPSLPFSGAYAEGNGLSFLKDGVEFTLENLLPGAFNERLTRLGRRRDLGFAHDALSYDPKRKKLWDPFGATRTDVLRSINRAHGSVSGTVLVLRGLIEAKELGLRLPADFVRWKARLLRLALRQKDAQAFAAAFVRQVATIAESLPEETIKEILRSRLVSAALLQVLGIQVEAAIAEYEALRAAQPGSVSNAALWLQVLLGAELLADRSEAVHWLSQGVRFEVLRSRKAVTQARELLTA